MAGAAEPVTLGAESPEMRLAARCTAPPADHPRQPVVDRRLPVAELLVGEERGCAAVDFLGGAPQQPAALAEVQVQLADGQVAVLQRLDQDHVKRLVPEQHVQHDLPDRRRIAAPAEQRDGTASRLVQPGQGTGRCDLQPRRRLRFHQRQQRLADLQVGAQAEQRDLRRPRLYRQRLVQRTLVRATHGPLDRGEVRRAGGRDDPQRRVHDLRVAGIEKPCDCASSAGGGAQGVVIALQTVGEPAEERDPSFVVHGRQDRQIGQFPKILRAASGDRHRGKVAQRVEHSLPPVRRTLAVVPGEQLVQHFEVTRPDGGQHGVARPVVMRIPLQNRPERVTRRRGVHSGEPQHGLHADACVRVAGKLRDQIGGIGVIQVALCQHHRVLAHPVRPPLDGTADVFHFQRVECLQRPERVQPGKRVAAGSEHLPQGRHGRRIVSLHEEPLGGVAPPLVGMPQSLHERRQLGPGQCRAYRRQPLPGNDPVDSPLVVPGPQVERRFDRVRDPLGVLDDLAVHVDDVERPLGSGCHRNRPEPVVTPRQKLGSLGPAARDKAGSVRRQHVLVHDVDDHVVHEQAALVGRRQPSAAVVADARAAREVPGLIRVVDAGLGVRHLEELRGAAVVRDHVAGGRQHEPRVVPQTADGKQHVLDVVDVVGAEHPAPRVEGDAVPPGGLERRLQGAGIGPEAEVGAANRDGRLGPPGRMAAAMVAAVGGVDPVVDAPREAVDVVLGVLDREAGEQDVARVGHPVAIRVAQVQDVGRRGHQHAVPPRQDRCRIRQFVGEERPGLVVAVKVFIDQPLDPAQRRRPLRPHRVAAHLDHEHPAGGIERDRYRIDDRGFLRGQLEAQIVGKLRRGDELVGIKRRAAVVAVHAPGKDHHERRRSGQDPGTARTLAWQPRGGACLHASPATRRPATCGDSHELTPIGTVRPHHDLPRPFQVPVATAGTNASSPSGRNGRVRPCSALM